MLGLSGSKRCVDYIKPLRRSYLQINDSRNQPICRKPFVKDKQPGVLFCFCTKHLNEPFIEVLRERDEDTPRGHLCSFQGSCDVAKSIQGPPPVLRQAGGNCAVWNIFDVSIHDRFTFCSHSFKISRRCFPTISIRLFRSFVAIEVFLLLRHFISNMFRLFSRNLTQSSHSPFRFA